MDVCDSWKGLAMPREETEFELSYYNSNTCWIHIDKLLAAFGLSRSDMDQHGESSRGSARLASKMPTYITLKDVKKRWGHGQEDIFPVQPIRKVVGRYDRVVRSWTANLSRCRGCAGSN